MRNLRVGTSSDLIIVSAKIQVANRLGIVRIFHRRTYATRFAQPIWHQAEERICVPPYCKLRIGLVASWRNASNTMMNPNAARIAFEIPGAALYLGEKVKGLTCPTRVCGCGGTLLP